MSLETASFIHQLNPSNPSGADRLKEGDDHIRLVKNVLKNTFPGIDGPLDPSITPAFLKAIANQLVPRGAVCLFAGTVAPAGWWLCDGSTAILSDGSGTIVTPDLRGRVPVGADSTHTLGSLFGQYAKTVTSDAAGAATPIATINGDGSHAHAVADTALTYAQMPAHKHSNGIQDNTAESFPYGPAPLPGPGTNSGPNNNSEHATTQGYTSTEGNGAPHGHAISGTGAHTHTVTVAPIAAHAHAVAIDTSQPSIAVNFIIKV